MPYFRLSVGDNTPAPLLQTSTNAGPVVVEASDETTARVIAKTNFWTVWRDEDGYPQYECLWTDHTHVMCVEIAAASVGHARLTPAQRGLVTCPDFEFGNGRFARLVSWPHMDPPDEDRADAAFGHLDRPPDARRATAGNAR